MKNIITLMGCLALLSLEITAQTFVSASQLQLPWDVASQLFSTHDGSWVVLGNIREPVGVGIFKSYDKWKFEPIADSALLPQLKRTTGAYTFNSNVGWMGRINWLGYTRNFKDWSYYDIGEEGREVRAHKVDENGPFGAVIHATSYIVTRRDSVDGAEITWIQGIVNKLFTADFDNVTTLYVDSNSAHHPYSNIVKTQGGKLCASYARTDGDLTYMVLVNPDGTATTVDAPPEMPVGVSPTCTFNRGSGQIWCFYGSSRRSNGTSIPASLVVYYEATGQSTWKSLPGINAVSQASTNGTLVVGTSIESGIVLFQNDSYQRIDVFGENAGQPMPVLSATFVNQDTIVAALQTGITILPVKDLITTSIVESKPGVALRRTSNQITFENMLNGDEVVTWVLYDLLGRQSAQGMSALGDRNLTIEAGSLPNGTYSLMLSANGRAMLMQRVLIE